jgi:hypothetical protein
MFFRRSSTDSLEFVPTFRRGSKSRRHIVSFLLFVSFLAILEMLASIDRGGGGKYKSPLTFQTIEHQWFNPACQWQVREHN